MTGVYNLLTKETVMEFKMENIIRSADFNQCGTEIVIGGEDCKTTIQNLKTKQIIFDVQRTEQIINCSFS